MATSAPDYADRYLDGLVSTSAYPTEAPVGRNCADHGGNGYTCLQTVPETIDAPDAMQAITRAIEMAGLEASNGAGP